MGWGGRLWGSLVGMGSCLEETGNSGLLGPICQYEMRIRDQRLAFLNLGRFCSSVYIGGTVWSVRGFFQASV